MAVSVGPASPQYGLRARGNAACRSISGPSCWGDLRQNIKLMSGDVILVPDRTSEQAFIIAAIAGGGLPRHRRHP